MDSTASSPATPRWNIERPFLTGHFYQESKFTVSQISDTFSKRSSQNPIGSYPTSVQELLVIDDLLSALVGIEGRYISTKRIRGKEGNVTFHVDASADFTLQELAKRIFPLCENFVVISHFVESRSHFKKGLVNHAFAAALRAILVDYQAMVAQLEHQFRLGRLSIQGLWFFCQPMMGSMHALCTVIEKALTDNCSGSAVLNLLQNQAKAMAGDNAVRALLEKMTQCASTAYLRILERWVYEGIIDDPYGEFFISENKLLQKESLTQDYDAKYWQQRYSLKDGIPSFLLSASETILITGKYLNVMRECGHSVQVPLSENSQLMSFGSNHHYLERIKAAYDIASGELLNLIKSKYDLMSKLRSLKRYLLLDQGDFLVHFMDIARDELIKRPDEISVEKLQERSSLLNRLSTLKDLESGVKNLLLHTSEVKIVEDSSDQIEPMSITGLETFSLSYKVHWPVSLVISRKSLTKYQLIFRFLFHCEHVNRQLCGAWQVHQGVRAHNTFGTAISRSSLLCRSMLKFINSLLHYLTFEVLEPNWHVMNDRLQYAKSIDEVIQYHDFFLEKCLKECLLLLPELLKVFREAFIDLFILQGSLQKLHTWKNLLQKVEKLKNICLQYAAAIQRLIPSIFIPKTDPTNDTSGRGTSKPRRSRQKFVALKLAAENTTVTDSVMKFEKEFNTELRSLGPLLSNSSHAEPYLTHLAQCILGLKSDQ